MSRGIWFSRILVVVTALCIGSAAFAKDGAWLVKKSSGEVWTSTSGAQQASLTQESELKPGDTIRTGRNGRVLLVRGEETIMVSPNSVIGIPVEKTNGLSTTIVQRAGSILLEVEKRNVKHFEVETPYLAAVVKGTKFSVSVDAAGTRVAVWRGQVEVADFKSGQIAQVLPGQVAKVFAQGKPGLFLGGSGTFSPIEKGSPRAPSIERVAIPRNGLTAPRSATNGQQIRDLAQGNRFNAAIRSRDALVDSQHMSISPHAGHGMRISSSLGEVQLNFQKVTHGMARGASLSASGSDRRGSNKETIWKSREGSTRMVVGGNSNQGNSGEVGSGVAITTSASAVAAATADPSHRNANADGNGTGNGNGNGNGHEHGNQNGSGHGHGYGYGRSK